LLSRPGLFLRYRRSCRGETNPFDPVVITIGAIHGRTKNSIIPDEVKLQLTGRTYKPEVRTRVLAPIARLAEGEAIAAGAP
jgi:metal-dependent amidase/aminoacylase/carboxypeptidase family protein